MVAQYEIPDVHLLATCQKKTKAELMANADVFSTPALRRVWYLTLLESMAVGTPIVAGNNSGYASVMTGKRKAQFSYTFTFADDFVID